MPEPMDTAADHAVDSRRWQLPFVPESGTAIVRRYALAGVAWAVVAAVMALGALAPLSLGWGAPWPVLGVGRLDGAYRLVALWGATWLPLMAGLLWLADLGAAAPRAVRAAGYGFWLWQAALLAGVAAILLGFAAPDPWSASPAPIQLLLWLAVALSLWALWSALAAAGTGVNMAGAGALVAGVALLATQTVVLLGAVVAGVGQAVVFSFVVRLQGTLCVPLAGLALACAVLPTALGRPLYSRKLLLTGWMLWVPIAVLAAGQDLIPGLYPPFLVPVVTAAAVLWLLPVAMVAVAVFGTWVGEPVHGIHPVATFLSLAMLAVLAAAVSRLGILLVDQEALAFTAIDPAHVLVPPLVMGGWWAAGAAYGILQTGDLDRRPRQHLVLLAAASLLATVPLMAVALAEATSGPSAALASLEAGLRLPGAVAQLAAVVVWAAAVRASPVRQREGLPLPSPDRPPMTPLAVAIATAGALVAALFLALFVPLADPDALRATPLVAARDVAAAPLRAEGRRRYVAEGCVACHTQRVSGAEADGRMGPLLRRGDYGPGPALVGQRRMGPDLAWVGDRHATPEELAAAMAPHGAGGGVPLPTLLADDRGGPGDEPLFDYLLHLNSNVGPGHD